MRGLTIILASADETRLRAALGLALSQAALGGNAKLFFDTAAVAALRPPIAGKDDAHWATIGFPGLGGLIAEALDAGVAMIVCQAGLALSNLSMEALDPRIAAGGMIGLLTTLGDDRLVTV